MVGVKKKSLFSSSLSSFFSYLLQSCPNMEEVMNGFLGSHPVANGFPSTCPVDEKSLASLLVDNALLRAQLVLLREGTYV